MDSPDKHDNHEEVKELSPRRTSHSHNSKSRDHRTSRDASHKKDSRDRKDDRDHGKDNRHDDRHYERRDYRRENVRDEENSKVYIAKLPSDLQKNDLEDLFSKFGTVIDITIKNKFAFIVKIYFL